RYDDRAAGFAAIASAGGHANPRGRASRQRLGAIQLSWSNLRRSGLLGQHRQCREDIMINVAKWALLTLLALPVLELAVFIAVAAASGFGWALRLVLARSAAGLLILRYAGRGEARMRVALGQGSFTSWQAGGSGGSILIAGILLLIPGFITDIAAL